MTLHIGWEGSFSGTLSLAQVNVELVRRLARIARISIIPRRLDGTLSADGVPEDLLPYVQRPLPKVDVHVTHGIPVIARRPSPAPWAWMQPWEYGAALPLDWLPALRDDADLVLVYSTHVRDTFIDAGLAAERIAVARLGIDPSLWDPAATASRPLPTSKPFRFLYVGGLTHRKGVDLLLAGFRAAFSREDPVALVVKPVDPEGLYTELSYPDFAAGGDPDAPEIIVLPTELAKHELPGVYAACQAFVHPYRGEGFCLPLAEAMAMGLLAICTGRGGASDFCRPDTAWLLPSDTVYFPHRHLRHRPLSNFPHWQEADLDALVTAMRRAVRDEPACGATAERGQRLVRTEFTWDSAAAGLHARLSALAASAADPGPRGCAEPDGFAQQAQTANTLVDLADTLLAVGDHESAGRLYHRALRDLDPGLGEPAAKALAGLARVAVANRISENGYLFARYAADHAPADPEIRKLLSDMAVLSGRSAEAGIQSCPTAAGAGPSK